MADYGKKRIWHPLDEDVVNAIDDLFAEIFPESEYGRLCDDIADYWIERLEKTWEAKPEAIKQKDLAFNPHDPLSRILPKTVVIAYPDSVFQENESTLDTLESFLEGYFPSAGGLHILPACPVVSDRFNDGYFSQVKRDAVHKPFGTGETFSRLMKKYFSMADFVLNHVDIENPNFKAYLGGDDHAGSCFYVYSENMYHKLTASGAFDNIFRPRPFPLFTIFRRTPADEIFAQMDFEQRCTAVNDLLAPDILDNAVIGILSIFDKVRNDQVLLDEDYRHITIFRDHLVKTGIHPDVVFQLSNAQESRNTPYIFSQLVETRSDLLASSGYDVGEAARIARRYEFYDPAVFGEQIRAMTTFSHVQVDVNTSTFEGLKMLADDFSWYLGLDINMLRLDAANYAFKKFHTSCFGLPEAKKLMKILYLSMECVAPRIVANLEVNDGLDVILSQMSDTESPPPMMYDFHLPCLLPVVFNTENTRILDRIFERIAQYEIPKNCIRFSLAESHDGKSVRGSMDLLRFSERWLLSEIVEQNNGRIKYKAAPFGRCSTELFRKVCLEAGLEYDKAVKRLFRSSATSSDETLALKNSIRTIRQIFDALDVKPDDPDKKSAILFFADKVLKGREPYELCCSTRDSLIRITDEAMEAKRFLGFYALAFALMGRNIKSLYFNDMPGLPNDLERMNQTGEYRDIKRTRSRLPDLAKKITGDGIHSVIARGIDALIRIVDNDRALGPRGNEAKTIPCKNHSVAVVCNHFPPHCSLTIVNTTGIRQEICVDMNTILMRRDVSAPAKWIDCFENQSFQTDGKTLGISLSPYERLWLKPLDDCCSAPIA
jgi:hypothetical protein